MKVCPHCQLANEERFPACLWCNTPLMGVRSTPAADPAHPEHRQRAQGRERRRITRRQLAFAGLCYVAAVAGLAFAPGLVTAPSVLGFYAASGLVIALTIFGGVAGPFFAGFAQGAFSLTLLLTFGPVQPLAFFMLLGHLLLPMVFEQWVNLIHDANR